jgi:hypothetical protein
LQEGDDINIISDTHQLEKKNFCGKQDHEIQALLNHVICVLQTPELTLLFIFFITIYESPFPRVNGRLSQ